MHSKAVLPPLLPGSFYCKKGCFSNSFILQNASLFMVGFQPTPAIIRPKRMMAKLDSFLIIFDQLNLQQQGITSANTIGCCFYGICRKKRPYNYTT